jgi:hypothetical protein
MTISDCSRIAREWPSTLVVKAITTSTHRVLHLSKALYETGKNTATDLSKIKDSIRAWESCQNSASTSSCLRTAGFSESTNLNFLSSIPKKIERITQTHLTDSVGRIPTATEKFLAFDPTTATLAATGVTDLAIDTAVFFWKLKKARIVSRGEWTDRDVVGEIFKWGAAAALATTLSAPLGTTMLWYGATRVARSALSYLFTMAIPQDKYVALNGVKVHTV